MSKNKALVGNAADPQQVQDAAKREKLARDNHLALIKHQMSTPQGREFVAYFLSLSKRKDSHYAENSLRMAYLAGVKDFGLLLEADIDAACPELYDELRREQRQRERETTNG